MSRTSATLVLVAAGAAAIFLTELVGHAATVGSWQKTCVARNRLTGALESVPDVNVVNPAIPFWGLTTPRPDGGWLIQYNLVQISSPLTTPAVLKFLFYHECAHAMTGSSDERVADCGGLAAMRRDMAVTPQMMSEIAAVYRSVGRSFPTGGPC